MAKNSSVNLDITPNADGYSIAGGITPRTLTLTAGNVTLSAGGSNTYTLPAATGTLVSRDSTDTLTNKTVDANSNSISNIDNAELDSSAGALGGAWTSYTPTLTGFSGTPTINYAQYKEVGKVVFLRLRVTGTSNSTSKTFTLPVSSASSGESYAMSVNEHSSTNPIGFVSILSSASTGQVYGGFNASTGTSGFSGWPSSGTVGYRIETIVYQSA